MTKNKIQQGFSRSAKKYDLFTSLHRSVADKLFDRIAQGPAPRSVVDVGCGTGYLTGKIKDHWPQTRVVGLDFAEGMLAIAGARHRSVEWVLGDGSHTHFTDEDFELVVSNLAYQWAEELPVVFKEARRLLSSGGVLVCTLFGFNTANELFQSLHEAKADAVQFTRLPDESHVRHTLTAGGWQEIAIEVQQEQHEFKNMYELIKWLKSIGANNLKRQGFIGPEALARAADIYRQKFAFGDGIGATFEVIQVYAKK